MCIRLTSIGQQCSDEKSPWFCSVRCRAWIWRTDWRRRSRPTIRGRWPRWEQCWGHSATADMPTSSSAVWTYSSPVWPPSPAVYVYIYVTIILCMYFRSNDNMCMWSYCCIVALVEVVLGHESDIHENHAQIFGLVQAVVLELEFQSHRPLHTRTHTHI